MIMVYPHIKLLCFKPLAEINANIWNFIVSCGVKDDVIRLISGTISQFESQVMEFRRDKGEKVEKFWKNYHKLKKTMESPVSSSYQA